MLLQPNERYRRAFKEGMVGWDVQALQIGLNSHQRTLPVTEDGHFGPQTRECVLREQRNHHLTQDGIAGLLTQRAIAVAEANAAEATHRVAKGLTVGIIEGESGYAFAATTPKYTSGTAAGSRDVGLVQKNLSERQLQDQEVISAAFRVRDLVRELAGALRSRHNSYFGRPGASTHKRAWELAVLYHNWPSAAVNMSQGHGPYLDSARNDRDEQWIIDIGVPGVRTPNQWVAHYIQSKTMYVTDWPS